MPAARRIGWPWWIGATVVAVGVVGVAAFLVFGQSKTPTSADAADRLYAEGVHPGQTRDEVDAWLAARGITPGGAVEAGHYSTLRRREDVTFPGWWMDCVGHQTVAECAGLTTDEVHLVVRVTYWHSNFYGGNYTVTVYLFFDVTGRLLRHWAHEFHICL